MHSDGPEVIPVATSPLPVEGVGSSTDSVECPRPHGEKEHDGSGGITMMDDGEAASTDASPISIEPDIDDDDATTDLDGRSSEKPDGGAGAAHADEAAAAEVALACHGVMVMEASEGAPVGALTDADERMLQTKGAFADEGAEGSASDAAVQSATVKAMSRAATTEVVRRAEDEKRECVETMTRAGHIGVSGLILPVLLVMFMLLGGVLVCAARDAAKARVVVAERERDAATARAIRAEAERDALKAHATATEVARTRAETERDALAARAAAAAAAKAEAERVAREMARPAGGVDPRVLALGALAIMCLLFGGTRYAHDAAIIRAAAAEAELEATRSREMVALGQVANLSRLGMAAMPSLTGMEEPTGNVAALMAVLREMAETAECRGDATKAVETSAGALRSSLGALPTKTPAAPSAA